uniref:carbonic anhydrase n=1 Tax=Syphacia muris TaxID=451379 RepID=A0A0N5AJW0_9BILA
MLSSQILINIWLLLIYTDSCYCQDSLRKQYARKVSSQRLKKSSRIGQSGRYSTNQDDMFFLGNQTYNEYENYSYGPNGYPSTWPAFCTKGKYQSPIDLRNAVVTRRKPFVTYVNYDVSGIVQILNDGHTIKLTGFRWADYGPYVMHNIDGRYKFYRLKQVQFHWGPKDLLGSEHTFAGFHMPLEIQFVHERVRTPKGPVIKNDILIVAVLGTTIVERNSRISTFGGITAALPLLVEPGSAVVRRLGSLMDMIPDDTHSFYYYHGSRTVPNCEENVSWLVLDNAIYVSRAEACHSLLLLTLNWLLNLSLSS